VTGSELGSYVKQAVSDRAAAAGMRLTPQASVSEQEGLNRGDFVFRVAPLDTPRWQRHLLLSLALRQYRPSHK